MTEHFFEEEEFSSQFNRRIVRRILGLARPHWRWVAGFLFFFLKGMAWLALGYFVLK